MARPRAFVSFDFDNNSELKILFSGQMKNSRTPFDIEDWSSKTQLPQSQWESIIRTKINKCHMLIVLVGKHAYSASGVVKEISFAAANNVPVFGIYVAGAGSSSVLPAGLSRSRVCSWDWEAIAGWVDQCMREGKNRVTR